MRAWRPAKWKLFSQPNMVFGCVLLFGWDRATHGGSAIQPKIFFSQPNGEDQSPRSETSATSGILLRNQICVRHCRSLRQFGCSSLWVAKALHRRENQKKKIFCVACGATNFFFNRSPRGWGGLGRSVYLPFLECVSVLK